MPIRSGTGRVAAQASSAAPSRPPSCLEETRTLYAGWPPTFVVRAAAGLRKEARDLAHGRQGAGVASAGLLRQRGAIDRVRRRVEDRDRALVPDDLDVAGIRLELQPAAPVRGRPEAAGGAGHQRRPD